MSNTLLPCPFCGGEADVEEIPGSPFTNEPYMWAVGCEECNIGWYKETKEEAIAAWNHRADVAPVVRGKWKKGKDFPSCPRVKFISDAYYCSVCENEAYYDTDYGQQLFNFCPNCGADMRKNEKE